jgi:hypothetical protein
MITFAVMWLRLGKWHNCVMIYVLADTCTDIYRGIYYRLFEGDLTKLNRLRMITMTVIGEYDETNYGYG